MLLFWDRLRQFVYGPQLPWVILWLGLAVLIVGLIVLTRTRWGQSHPLRKCAVLSLLVHLLLAAYATTVQIVSAGSPTGHSATGTINVTLIDDADSTNGGREAAVWNKLTTGGAPILPAAGELARTESPPPVDSQKPELARETTAAASKPLLGGSPTDMLAQIKTSGDASAAALKAAGQGTVLAADAAAHVKSAAAIDATVAPQAASSADIEPSPASPDRQSLAPPDALPKPGDAAAAIANILSPLPTPDSLSALDSPDGTIHGDSLHGGTPTNNKHAINAAGSGGASSNNGTSASQSSSGSGVDPAWKNIAAGPARLALISIDAGAAGAATAGVARTSTAPAPAPKIYQDRLSNNRPELLRQRGGSAETEAAVQKALKWLALVQESNGRFDAEKYGAGRETSALGQNRDGAGIRSDTGVTALALLAMLGSGNTHLHGQYARNVQHGLEWLLSMQASDGNLGGQATTFSFMYCHGMATFAMSEDYAMTHDRRLEQPLRRAIAYTIAAQHPTTGGWRYRPHEMGDTSQLGWQLMALKSAELAGIPMPEQTRDGAIRFLKSVASGNSGGLSSYRPGELPTRTMTAEALVCRQFLGMARDNPAADEAGRSLLAELPNKDNVNPYYWYYGTLGMYQLQGEYWQRWNEALQSALIGRQQTDGEMAGSWDPVCVWDGYGGRIYSTAVSALCLEVYYRFLPLYKDSGSPTAPASPSGPTGSAAPSTTDR
jgi:hypothetical protein